MKTKMFTFFKAFLLICLFPIINLQAQVIFSEDFDNVGGPTAGGAGTYSFPSGWTKYNVDNRTPAGGVFYVNEAWERREDFAFNNLDSAAFSTSWYTPAGAADDWMVTPAIALPASGTLTLSWNAITYDASYPDGYEVRIGNAPSSNPANSTVLFSIPAENTAWTARTVSLNAYAGQTVYISFRNNSFDEFLLLIDDIVVNVAYTYEASISGDSLPSRYSQIPITQVAPLNLGATITNNGTNTLTNVALGATILKDGVVVQTLSSSTIPTLASLANNAFTISGYTPASGIGTYTVKYYPIMTETDQNSANDTATRTFEVTPTTYSRHTGAPVGALGIGSGTGDGLLGSLFTITSTTTLQELSVYFTRGYFNGHTRARIYTTTGGIPDNPATPLWESDLYAYPDDSARTVSFTSPTMPTLPPGTYWFGCQEIDSTLQIALHNNIFTLNTQWVYWSTSPAGGWATNEFFGVGFAKTYAISPIVGCIPAAAPSIAITGTPNDSLSVCANTSVTLTAVSGGGTMTEYLWYKNGIAVNYQNGGPGTYTFNTGNNSGTDVYTLEVVYSGNVCLTLTSASATVVKSNLTSTITPAGPTSFCANTPTTLNANAGMTNYVWKRSATTVQSGASSSYMPTASGNHNVTITDANGCSKTSTWTNIIVKPLPTANAGVDKNVCEGSSVAIGSTNNPANTYTWSPTTALSNSTVSNPMASPLTNTTYTLTVTNTSTTCSNTDMVLVTSLAPPAIPSIASTTTPVCQGTTIAITPTSAGASSINWYKNGILQFNKPTNFINNITLPSVSADAYTIAAKGANGCLSGLSNVVNAWVKEAAVPTTTTNPQAVGNLVTVCEPGGTSGNAIFLANSTTASPSYSWKLGNAYIAGANQNSYLVTVTTTQNNKVISVEATYPNGCVKTSTTKIVKLVTSGCGAKLGSDKEEADLLVTYDEIEMTAYPNPSQDILNIQISNIAASEGKLHLYNTLGQIVKEQTISFTTGKAEIQWDLKELAIGLYTLSFQTNNVEKTLKVVKE